MKQRAGIWEWVEEHPVGRIIAGTILGAWIVLYFVYRSGIWTIDVTFFVAVAALTFGLGLLSALAAVVQFQRRNDSQPPKLYRAPGVSFLSDVENYFRWLTPVAFITGVIFAHFFWH